ncbi:uncharacterized protein LOC144446321 [Glandiceps talaboti]
MDDESRKGRQTQRPGLLLICADFANLFKTFLGLSYITIPFGLRKSGIILGLLQLIVVASLFYHACLVIIKCKKIVVHRLQANASPNDEESDDEALEYLERHLTYMDIAQFSFGKIGKTLVEVSLCVAQFSFCVGYLVFIGNTLASLFCIDHQPITTETPAVVNETMIFYKFAQSGLDSSGWKFENISSPLAGDVERRNYTSGIDGIVTRKANDEKSSERIQDNPNMNVAGSFDLSFDDGLRHISHVVSDDVVLFNWQSFLLMFGMAISAYESVGMIIPVESSMVGHRERFPIFLSIVIITFSILMITVGVVGYLFLGNDTEQIILDNLTNHTSSELLLFLQIAISLSVLFTYPLQIQPLIEVVEKLLFTEGKICGPNSVEEERSLSVDDDTADNQLHRAEAIPKSVAAWKRNIVRVALVLLTAAVAILLNDSISYVNAFAAYDGGGGGGGGNRA